MICLTGDVHHRGFRYREFPNPDLAEVPPARRPWIEASEARLAADYVGIARGHGLKVTLFVTGRALRRDWPDLAPALAGDDVEIGGHTWRAFEPRRLHEWFRRATGSLYGPALFQRWDIARTVAAVQARAGRPAVSWRTHAYASDAATPPLLARRGIRVLSDAVEPASLGPRPLGPLVLLPINVLPDHEHIHHAERTPAALARAPGPAPGFADGSYPIGRWLDIVKAQVDAIETRDGVATLLVHPLCMYATDRFRTFTALCRFLAGRRSSLCREAAAVAR